MTNLYANATRLRLATGDDVEAFVHIEPGANKRPKCLLLHGNPGCLLDWERLVPRLLGVADIAAIDMPGFGRTQRRAPGPEAPSLDGLAQEAILVADALGWREPIFLGGHSHGGGVAQAVAARYPDRVAGLALIATLGAPAHGSYRLLSAPGAVGLARVAGRMFRSKLFRHLNRAILRNIMRDILSPEPVTDERLERELASFASCPDILVTMVQVTRGRPCAQLFDSASDIRCPTLFVHGGNDALVPPSCARAIHERILSAGGRSQFQLLPEAGHMLVAYQATELANMIHDLMLGNLSGDGASVPCP